MDNMKNKSCPFCGREDLDSGTTIKGRDGTPFWIVCTKCGATGPWIEVADEELDLALNIAMEEWNTRT